MNVVVVTQLWKYGKNIDEVHFKWMTPTAGGFYFNKAVKEIIDLSFRARSPVLSILSLRRP